jgi:threonine synthase
MAEPPLFSELACFGCGARVGAGDPLRFRCPGARPSDGVDHVLRSHRTGDEASWRRRALAAFDGGERNPFLRYRDLLHVAHRALAAGLDDRELCSLIEELDGAIAEVSGHGFTVTPCEPAPELAQALGLGPDLLLAKDETGNVSGSHKARHLLGVLLCLEAERRRSGATAPGRRPRLAIASCGNAALAAAVVASATGYPLDVYVPPQAEPAVVARLLALDAHLVPCPRRQGESGDPCYLRFREAVQGGALPFTCQGPENGLAIDGGQTLAWEIVSLLRARDQPLERLFVQVGGGALASACIQGLRTATELGALPALPRVHAVQTEGCAPLRRAWRRLAEEIASRHTGLGAAETRAAGDAALAERIAAEVSPPDLEAELHRAARRRSRYMWPWESEPHSLAGGILDDETYDWLAVVEGMLLTGGHPLVVSEEEVAAAHRLTGRHTAVAADATGSAGLAGCLRLVRLDGEARASATGTWVVLLTGAARNRNHERAEHAGVDAT